jgi:hypothetical protein
MSYLKLSLLLSLSLLVLSFSIHGQDSNSNPKLPELAKEIKKMRDIDQKNRIKWSGMIRKGKDDTEKFKAFTKEVIAADRRHTARMREIVNQFGWPTYDLVGKGPSNSAWLIVQHADRNPLFQARCLPLLEEAVKNQQANPRNYAYLYDRVQVSQGRKQRYATQSSTNNGLTEGQFYPLEDEFNVQKNREAMGVTRSVKEYANSMGFDYTIPTPEEAKEREAQLHLKYESNLSLAKKAVEADDPKTAAGHYLKTVQCYGLVTTEDFIEASRVLALAQHKESIQAYTFLTRAMARGWDGFDQVISDPDFTYLQTSNPGKWSDLVITAEEMELDR